MRRNKRYFLVLFAVLCLAGGASIFFFTIGKTNDPGGRILIQNAVRHDDPFIFFIDGVPVSDVKVGGRLLRAITFAQVGIVPEIDDSSDFETVSLHLVAQVGKDPFSLTLVIGENYFAYTIENYGIQYVAFDVNSYGQITAILRKLGFSIGE